MHLLTADSREVVVPGFFMGGQPVSQSRSQPNLGRATRSRRESNNFAKLPIEIIRLWETLHARMMELQRRNHVQPLNETKEQFLDAVVARCEYLQGSEIHTPVKKFVEPIYSLIYGAKPVYESASRLTGMSLSPDSLLGGINYIVYLDKGSIATQHRIIRFLLQIGQTVVQDEGYQWASLIGQLPIQRAVLSIHIRIVDLISLIDRSLNDTEFSSPVHYERLPFLDSFNDKLNKFVTGFRDAIDQLQTEIFNLRFNGPAPRSGLSRSENDGHNAREDVTRTKEARARQQQKISDRNTFGRCNDWIPSADFHSLYRERCEEHLAGTGSWLLKSDNYLHWRNVEESSILWVQGIPGSGKSILSTIAITDLNNTMDPESGVAYVLCQRTQQNKQSLALLLGTMIKQLSRQRNEFHKKVIDAYLKRKLREVPDTERLLSWLDSTTDMFQAVYLLVDALDEFQSPKELLRGFETFWYNRRFDRRLKILIFSRPEAKVKQILDLPLATIEVEVENQDDIEFYIKHHMPDPVYTETRAICKEKADGMFMWPKLVFQEFPTPSTPSKGYLKAIQELPPGLNGMYDRIFKEMYLQADNERKIAFTILNWMLKAFRPITAAGMISALQEYETVIGVDGSKLTLKPESLETLCKHLITCEKDGALRFIHESVRLYLDQPEPKLVALQNFQKEGKQTHDIMATVCLRYLEKEDFDQHLPISSKSLRTLATRHPFLFYAADFWGQHASQGELDKHEEAIFDLIKSTQRRELCVQISFYDPSEDEFWYFPNSTTPLHALAMFDLPSLAETLWNSRGGEKLYAADGNSETPLVYSLQFDQQKMASYLIEIVSNTNDDLLSNDLETALASVCSWGWIDTLSKLIERYPELINRSIYNGAATPLVLAAAMNQEETVMQLIELGANVTQTTEVNEDFPLRAAAEEGLKHATEALLKHGAMVDQQNTYGHTALHFAAGQDHDVVVAILLQAGANPMISSHNNKQTPLHDAAHTDAAMAIEELLKGCPGLDLGIKRLQGYTPLHMAVWGDAKRAVNALIKLEAPLDAIDDFNRTALHLAIERGASEIAKILIKAGCDISIADDDKDTALHTAARNSHYDIIKAIFDSVEETQWLTLIQARNNLSETPLHLACRSGHLQSVDLLISNGSDCYLGGIIDASPLHYAAHFGHPHLISSLLHKTRDANPRDKNMSTPLHYAATAKRSNFITCLMEVCAQMDLGLQYSALTRTNTTPLFNAISEGDIFIAQLLLPHTSSETFRNSDDSSNQLIHHAAWFGDENLIQILLEYDAGLIAVRGFKNRTPLICSVRGRQPHIFERILDLSLSHLEDVEETGQTALLVALARKDADFANRLLDVKADVDVVDNNSYSALHLAASAGDDVLFDRVLSLQKDCNIANRYGQTVCHIISIDGSLSMLKSLIQAGFTNIQARDRRGRNAGIYAAETKRLSILEELRILGISMHDPDHRGLVATHLAARNGHVHVLEYLAKHGYDVNPRAQDNMTPFLIAVCYGYESAIEYLMKADPLAVEEVEVWSKETTLIAAAGFQSENATRLLLEAGMDPKQPDAFGYTAEDLLAQWKNGTSGSFLLSHSERATLQQQQVLACLEPLLVHTELQTFSDADRANQYSMRLAKALRVYGDFENAKLCIYPWLFEPDDTLLSFPESCSGCQCPRIEEKVFCCKECYYGSVLCEKCYQDYIAADRSVPEGLAKFFELEESVRQLRLACADKDNVNVVALAADHFSLIKEFINTTIVSYTDWEKTYSARGAYDWLDRPGEFWSKIVSERIEVQDQGANIEETERGKRLATLERKYLDLSRYHNAEKDVVEFRCRNHDYFELSQREYSELKTAGIYYDTETGQPMERLFEKIKVEYDTQRIAKTGELALRDRSGTGDNQRPAPTIPKSVPSESDSDTVYVSSSQKADTATTITSATANDPSNPPLGLIRRQTDGSEILDIKADDLDRYEIKGSNRELVATKANIALPLTQASASSEGQGDLPTQDSMLMDKISDVSLQPSSPDSSGILAKTERLDTGSRKITSKSNTTGTDITDSEQETPLPIDTDQQSSKYISNNKIASSETHANKLLAEFATNHANLVSEDPEIRRIVFTALPMAEFIEPGFTKSYFKDLVGDASDTSDIEEQDKEGQFALDDGLENILDPALKIVFTSLKLPSADNPLKEGVSGSVDSIVIPDLPSAKQAITKPRLLVIAANRIRTTINGISRLSKRCLSDPDHGKKYPKEFSVDITLVNALERWFESKQTLFNGPVLSENYHSSNLNQAVVRCHHRLSWICLSIVYLQEARRLTNTLTILIQHDISIRLVDLLGISTEDIRELAMLFDRLTKLGDGLSEGLTVAEPLILETATLCQRISPRLKISKDENETSSIILRWQQIMDVLDLAILFHTEEHKFSLLSTEAVAFPFGSPFRLQSGWTCYLRKASCLSDFLADSPLWICTLFDPSEEGWKGLDLNRASSLAIRTKISSFDAVWGPVYKVDEENDIIQYNAGMGCIAPWDKSRWDEYLEVSVGPNERVCHWMPFNLALESSFIKQIDDIHDDEYHHSQGVATPTLDSHSAETSLSGDSQADQYSDIVGYDDLFQGPTSEDLLNMSKYAKENPLSFDDVLVIGASETQGTAFGEKRCTCSMKAFKKELEKHLHTLDTRPKITNAERGNFAVTTGYAGSSISQTFIPVTDKTFYHNQILDWWQNKREEAEPLDLRVLGAVKISICTRNAVRCRILDLFETRSIRRIIGQLKRVGLGKFANVPIECWDTFLKGDANDILQFWNDEPKWREFCADVILLCLQRLRCTGIDKKRKRFNALWVPPKNTRAKRVEFDLKHHDWLHALADGADTCSFTVLVEDCYSIMDDGRCHQSCKNKRRDEFRSRLQEKMIINPSLGPFKGCEALHGSLEKKCEGEIIKLSSGNFHACRGEYFWTAEPYLRFMVVKALGHDHLMITLSPSITDRIVGVVRLNKPKGVGHSVAWEEEEEDDDDTTLVHVMHSKDPNMDSVPIRETALQTYQRIVAS